jgi:hypothetical protein
VNETTGSSRPEPSRARGDGPAITGEVRRQLLDLLPDLDSDVVAQVLALTVRDDKEEE